jgi:hypothetical protein
MKDYRDILISFNGECQIFVYNEMGDLVIATLKIDVIDYEILFGLHEVMVTRCKVSPTVFDKLIELDQKQQEV